MISRACGNPVTSTFVIRFLQSMISNLALCIISSISLVSVSEHGWFEDDLVGNPKDRFSRGETHRLFTVTVSIAILNNYMYLFSKVKFQGQRNILVYIC